MNKLDKLAQDIEYKREVLDEARAKLVSKRNKIIVFVMLATLVAGCSTIGQAGFILAVVIPIPTYFLYESLIKKRLKALGLNDFRRDFKNLVFVPALDHYCENLVYEPFNSIPKEALDDSALFQRLEKFKYQGDDYAHGYYRGYNFKFSEIHLSEMRTSTSGNTTHRKRVSIFDGVLMQLDVPDYSGLRLFFVPAKKASQPSVDLTKIKFKRDSNMSLQEQRAYNLQLVSTSFNSFLWKPDKSGFELKEVEAPASATHFKLYTNQIDKTEEMKHSGAFDYLESNLITEERKDDKMVRKVDASEMSNNSLRGAFFSFNEGKLTVLFPHPMPQFEPDITKPIDPGLLKANFQYLEGMFKIVDGLIKDIK
ncbi:MAG: hypothetical protein AAF363_00935 [Bacteroidota bacterium]